MLAQYFRSHRRGGRFGPLCNLRVMASTSEERAHVSDAQFGRRTSQQGKQPLGTQIRDQSVVQRKQGVGGQVAFRLGLAATPLLPERREQRIGTVQAVPRVQLLPELPPCGDGSTRQAVLLDDEGTILFRGERIPAVVEEQS